MKDKLKSRIKNKDKEKKKIKSEIIFMIATIFLISIFCVAITPVALQNDTFYSIKIGEHISKYGIDMKDHFSWHEDLNYTYPHWLYDFITYQIYNLFGMTGIYISTCVLAIILGLLTYFVNIKLVKNKFFSFIITIGVMYIIRGFIAARAQLVTYILFLLTIYFIERFIETKKKRYAAGLIIIPITIANYHVAVFPFYFVLYLPYIAEYIIAALTEIILYRKIKIKILKNKIKKLQAKPNINQEKIGKLKNELEEIENKNDKIKIRRTKQLQEPYKIRLDKKSNVKWLILIMIICIFTGLLTPLGDTPYTYLAKTMQGNTTENINEHLPMTITKEKDLMCTLIVFLSILIFTKTKIRLSDLFMLCGLCYLALSARRQVSIFAIINSLVLNRMIIEMIKIYEDKKSEDIDKMLINQIPILLGLIAITLGLSFYQAKDKFNDSYISESSYPVKACDYIIENIDLGQSKFYNEYNYGSYMLFRGIPVFVDSRADLYAPEFSGKEEDIFMDFIETSNISKYYEDTFEKYNITHVITYRNSKTNMIITKTKDSNYKELYRDKYFVIYERMNV